MSDEALADIGESTEVGWGGEEEELEEEEEEEEEEDKGDGEDFAVLLVKNEKHARQLRV